MELLKVFLIELAFLFLPLFIVGLINGLLCRFFYSNFGSGGKIVCYVTGFFGTPIHELSHALMCLIFCHKIDEIKFFNIGDDGTLGYVTHCYNKRNLYQCIGNFFIGIAPMTLIGALMCVIMYFLCPNMFNDILSLSKSELSFEMFFNEIGIFFKYITTGGFWLFILICGFLALHMNLSRADIKGSLSGLIFLIILLALVNVILYFISSNAFLGFYNGTKFVCIICCLIWMISLLVSFVLFLLSLIVKIIRRG